MSEVNDSSDKKGMMEKLGSFCHYRKFHYLKSYIALFESGFGLVVNVYCKQIYMRKTTKL